MRKGEGKGGPKRKGFAGGNRESIAGFSKGGRETKQQGEKEDKF